MKEKKEEKGRKNNYNKNKYTEKIQNRKKEWKKRMKREKNRVRIEGNKI